MNFRELADTVFAASAADQTEVVYVRQDESLTRFANNYIHQNVTESNVQIAVRCVLGTRVGMAVSNDSRRESLMSLPQRACDLARLQPENPDFHGLPKPAPVREVQAFDHLAAECSPAQRANGVAVICRKASAAGYTAAGSMTTGTMRIGVANSEGVFGEQESTVVDGSTVVMSESSSGWAQASGWKLDAVQWEDLAEEALRKTRMGENPVECPPGDYTVILDPYATMDLVEMMAMDGMGALAFQEERSWMNGRIGEKIFSDSVTIVDDAFDPAGIPSSFDFEGLPKRTLPIVENGICKGPVYDSYTAARSGLSSTGHATPPSPSERYGPLPTNLFLRPGTSNLEDMIRSTKLGLYITRFWYTRVVHPRDVVVTGMTRDGTFLVEDGEIAHAVKSLRFTQSYLAALSRTAAMSRALRVLKSGLWVVTVPAVKLEQFRFTSATR